MIRDSAVVLVLLTGVGGYLGGAWFAAQIAAMGGLAMLNLALMIGLIRRITHAIAVGHNRSAGLAAGVLVLKSGLLLGVLLLVLTTFDPLALILGFTSVVIGAPSGVLLRTVLGPPELAPVSQETV